MKQAKWDKTSIIFTLILFFIILTECLVGVGLSTEKIFIVYLLTSVQMGICFLISLFM